jgi:hypothetical protein
MKRNMTRFRSFLASLLLATALAVGTAIAWGVFVGWSHDVLRGFWRSDLVQQHVVVRAGGIPLIETRRGVDYVERSYRSLEGEPVAVDRRNLWLSGARLPAPPRSDELWIRPGWARRIIAFHDAEEPPAYWYFLHDGRRRGHGYFVGYDSKTKLLLGYIGRSGL